MRTRILIAVACAIVYCIVGCGGGGGGYIPPGMSPVNGATNVPVTTDLSWTAMAGALSYDVYLGTDETLVTNADNTTVPEFKGNQVSLAYDPPGNLNYDTQYYWRIDKVDAGGPTAGAVWTFTTESAPAVAPVKVAGPDPGNGAGNVPIDKVLGWNGAVGATSYDVYFGTDQTTVANADNTTVPEFRGNQPDLTYDPPGNLSYSTTYYWRIDSVNGIGTTAGDVWSFTTASAPALPVTYHSGPISTSETWDVGHLHIVNGDVSIEGAGSPVVTVEAGAIVKLDAGCAIEVGYSSPGGLVAVGTSVDGITFTANSAAPTKGFWGSIYFYTNALTTSELDYCDINWGGNSMGAVVIHGTSGAGTYVKVSNCTVSNSGTNGVNCYDGGSFNVGSTGNTITGSILYPITIEACVTDTVAAGTYTGNGVDAVEVEDYYYVTSSGTWVDPGVPYVITGDVYVEGGSSPVLTIAAGATLKFDSGYGIEVGYSDPGGLVAVGTSGNRITFTANSASPTKGYWEYIAFWTQALTTSELDYCDINWGGGNYGVVLINGSGGGGTSVKVSNCNISNSGTNGINCYDGGSFNASSTGNVITNSTLYPVTMEACIADTLQAGTYTGNTVDAIEIEDYYYITSSGTWINPGVPYVITGSVYVDGVASPVLTISAGATLKFASGAALEVGYSDPGGLVADGGGAATRVTFTANTPTPTKGYWDGIFFYDNALASQLTYCTVEYAGTTPADGTYDGNITVYSPPSATLTLTNNIIRNSNSWGVVRYWAAYGGQPDYTDGPHANSFSNNGTAGTRHQSTPW